MSLASGARLGLYEITAPLGEGGMGVVYSATDSKLKREVAIKVLPAAFTEDKERLASFGRETTARPPGPRRGRRLPRTRTSRSSARKSRIAARRS